MRKLLIIVGAAACVVAIVLIGGFAFLAVQGGSLDAESKSYVESAVRAITAKWDREELVARASPELKDTLRPGDLANLFGTLAQLGPLVDYEGANGQANMAYFSGSGSSITAVYVAKARYQNGEATIDLRLQKRDGVWAIHYFHVNVAHSSLRERGT